MIPIPFVAKTEVTSILSKGEGDTNPLENGLKAAASKFQRKTSDLRPASPLHPQHIKPGADEAKPSCSTI